MNETDFKSLQEEIGYSFNKEDLLKEALTHPSMELPYSYERLEFLGDAILNMCIACMLFELFPKDNEGELSKKHMNLVCGERLYAVAQTIGIGKYLILSDSEAKTGGRAKLRNLENATESLIAAIFLDSNTAPVFSAQAVNNMKDYKLTSTGFFLKAVEKFIHKYWYSTAKNTVQAPLNPKSELQELAQSKQMALPIYEILQKTGQDHNPIFKIKVSIEGHYGLATASNKKLAENQAAENLLLKIKKL